MRNNGKYKKEITFKTGTKSGVDISLGTNGLLFDSGSKGKEALEHLVWIRFNLSAANDAGYRRIHASKSFDLLLEKIKFCVKTKKEKNLDVTIGIQMVVTPMNVDQAIPLAKLSSELGVDYLVLKQCGDTKSNFLGIYEQLSKYKSYEEIFKEGFVEDIDSARDRASITQEELNNKLSEQMNRAEW